MIKRVGIFFMIFLLGWSACLGLLTFKYDYNFINDGDGDLRPMLSSFILKQCFDDNRNLVTDIAHKSTESDAYFIAMFACQNKKLNNLIYQMSLASSGFEYMACRTKAERIGETEKGKCKAALDLKIATIKTVN